MIGNRATELFRGGRHATHHPIECGVSLELCQRFQIQACAIVKGADFQLVDKLKRGFEVIRHLASLDHTPGVENTSGVQRLLQQAHHLDLLGRAAKRQPGHFLGTDTVLGGHGTANVTQRLVDKGVATRT